MITSIGFIFTMQEKERQSNRKPPVTERTSIQEITLLFLGSCKPHIGDIDMSASHPCVKRVPDQRDEIYGFPPCPRGRIRFTPKEQIRQLKSRNLKEISNEILEPRREPLLKIIPVHRVLCGAERSRNYYYTSRLHHTS